MSNAADTWASGVTIVVTDSKGEPRSYVPEHTHDAIIARFQEHAQHLVDFGRAHGLTDEMWDEWKARA